ncbi:hypothetical protein CcaCcLH18_12005 [Colletotrichum camelliae]|nr:hypothetical protein CcaCcLH18_12005 [Colletotrichum camelliae]
MADIRPHYDDSRTVPRQAEKTTVATTQLSFPLMRSRATLATKSTNRTIFVSGTADPAEYYRAREDDHLGSTVDNFRDRKKWTEATEKVHISEADSGLPGGYTRERIDEVLSALVEGRVEEVRNYLESSKDADILLHGVEAHSVPQPDDSDSYSDGSTGGTKSPVEQIVEVTGNTALHLAACEASYEMVRLLLQKGAKPDAVNKDGRVPLMEAALWGRLRNVELLLEHGANKDIVCACHGQRLQAVDFARPLRNNSKERYSRTRGRYKEDAYQRDLDREAIVRLLSESLEERLPILSSFAFTRPPEDENLLTLISNFDIPNKWKTVAVLYRGSQLPTVAAMSGWAHEEDSDVHVGGREWTMEVCQLCDFIGYPLAPHQRDRGQPGRYYACHAEKQLVAFFVNKHLFLSKEVEKDADIARLSLHEPSDEEYEQQEIERCHREKLLSLREVEPSATIKKGKIPSSRYVTAVSTMDVRHVGHSPLFNLCN